MIVKIDNMSLPIQPKTIEITTMDLDNGDTTVRTADGTLVRDRVAVKRQIKMEFGLMTWAQISVLLTQMKPAFFQVNYPDPEIGGYETKTFYCGNRPVSVPFEKDGIIYWEGLNVTLTEK